MFFEGEFAAACWCCCWSYHGCYHFQEIEGRTRLSTCVKGFFWTFFTLWTKPSLLNRIQQLQVLFQYVRYFRSQYQLAGGPQTCHQDWSSSINSRIGGTRVGSFFIVRIKLGARSIHDNFFFNCVCNVFEAKAMSSNLFFGRRQRWRSMYFENLQNGRTVNWFGLSLYRTSLWFPFQLRISAKSAGVQIKFRIRIRLPQVSAENTA